jgi:hypothetical protein
VWRIENYQERQGEKEMCYHHYLQHTGHARLKETMKAVIY